jgi:hypothetical protein
MNCECDCGCEAPGALICAECDDYIEIDGDIICSRETRGWTRCHSCGAAIECSRFDAPHGVRGGGKS